MATKQAYMLRLLDGDMEPCAVVYATTERGAKRKWRAIERADDGDHIEVERRPAYDVYAPNGPTTADLFMTHGWYFACGDCHDERVCYDPADDPPAEVVSRDTVRCSACVKAKADAPTVPA